MLEQTLFAELPKGPISELLVERITRAIMEGDLRPGDKLPTEIEFCQQLGIGRNSIREAIKILVAFGVLEIKRSEGTFVVQNFNPKLMDPMVYGLIMESHSTLQMLELRISMLRSVMYLAVEKATDAGVEKLRSVFRKLTEMFETHPEEADVNYQLNEEFFLILGEISENPLVAQLNLIILRMSKYERITGMKKFSRTSAPPTPQPGWPYHTMLFNAIEQRDYSLIEPAIQKTFEVWKNYALYE